MFTFWRIRIDHLPGIRRPIVTQVVGEALSPELVNSLYIHNLERLKTKNPPKGIIWDGNWMTEAIPQVIKDAGRPGSV